MIALGWSMRSNPLSNAYWYVQDLSPGFRWDGICTLQFAFDLQCASSLSPLHASTDVISDVILMSTRSFVRTATQSPSSYSSWSPLYGFITLETSLYAGSSLHSVRKLQIQKVAAFIIAILSTSQSTATFKYSHSHLLHNVNSGNIARVATDVVDLSCVSILSNNRRVRSTHHATQYQVTVHCSCVAFVFGLCHDPVFD